MKASPELGEHSVDVDRLADALAARTTRPIVADELVSPEARRRALLTRSAAARALEPYKHPAGGWRCPFCGDPLRIIDTGAAAEIGGCHGHALTQLARTAVAAGYLDRSAA